MSASFSFVPTPRFFFGAGKIEELPGIIAEYGKKVLLIQGATSFGKTAHWQELQETLEKDKFEVRVERIKGEPSPEMVDQIVSTHRNNPPACVVAVGGGSVLDGGKAVSAMLPLQGSVEDYLEGVGSKTPDGRKTPFIAIPTTSGTGSEMTCNAVISKVGGEGFKKSLRHRNYMPDVAIVDPVLTLDCPREITSNCAMDAFSQLVESYLSTSASAITDDLALGAIRRLKDSLWRIGRSDLSLEDRANMSYGASISGITLTNAGLGVIHGFASTIGGRFAIPHGLVCGTLLAVANEVTLRKLREFDDFSVALGKYAELGRLFNSQEGRSEQYYQDSFIDTLHELTELLQPALLSDYGVGLADIATIVDQSSSKNNPVPLDDSEKMEILISRLE